MMLRQSRFPRLTEGADVRIPDPWSTERLPNLFVLSCDDGCENHLRHDPQWSSTISELPECHDEQLKREDFEKRGALDERKLMAMALAKLTGIEIPDTIAGMITGAAPHIAGLLECPAGHGQPPGSKFCNECGAPMSAPVTKAALDAPQRPAEPPAAAPSPSHRPMPGTAPGSAPRRAAGRLPRPRA